MSSAHLPHKKGAQGDLLLNTDTVTVLNITHSQSHMHQTGG